MFSNEGHSQEERLINLDKLDTVINKATFIRICFYLQYSIINQSETLEMYHWVCNNIVISEAVILLDRVYFESQTVKMFLQDLSNLCEDKIL